MKRKMTGSKKAATAAFAGNSPSVIERGRIRMDVTNGGIASDTHRIDENINNDKQRCAGTASGVKTGKTADNNAAVAMMRLDRLRLRICEARSNDEKQEIAGLHSTQYTNLIL